MDWLVMALPVVGFVYLIYVIGRRKNADRRSTGLRGPDRR